MRFRLDSVTSLVLVALLTLSGGCKELANIFAESKAAAGEPVDEEKLAAEQAAAEARRIADLKEREDAMRVGPDGPEPVNRTRLVHWLVRKRLRCGQADCTARFLARLQGMGDISGPLSTMVHDEVPSVRVEAVQLIGLLELKSAAPALVPLLTDASPTLRKAAVASLGWLKDESSAVALIRAMKGAPPGSRFRVLALQALGKIPGPVSLKGLVAAATSPHMDEARAAVTALSDRAEPEVVGALREAVALSEYTTVKRAALGALSSIGSSPALRALKNAAKSKDPLVRARAKELLGQD